MVPWHWCFELVVSEKHGKRILCASGSQKKKKGKERETETDSGKKRRGEREGGGQKPPILIFLSRSHPTPSEPNLLIALLHPIKLRLLQ